MTPKPRSFPTRLLAALLAASLLLASWGPAAYESLAQGGLGSKGGSSQRRGGQPSTTPEAWQKFLSPFLLNPQGSFLALILPTAARDPKAMDSLARVLARMDLDPTALDPSEAPGPLAGRVQEAAQTYADALMKRAGTAWQGDSSASRPLGLGEARNLRDELKDLAAVSEMVIDELLTPEGLQATLNAFEAKVSALETLRADKIEATVEEAREDWSSDQDKGSGERPGAGETDTQSLTGEYSPLETLSLALAAPAVDAPAVPDPGDSLAKKAKLPTLSKPVGTSKLLAPPDKAPPPSQPAAAPAKGFLAGLGRLLGRLFRKNWPRTPGVLTREPSSQAPGELPAEARLNAETQEALKILGLSYPEFQSLALAQAKFEREFLDANPAAAQAIFSLRNQQRFSRSVLRLARLLRDRGEKRPLAKALAFSLVHFYYDLLEINGPGYADFLRLAHDHFHPWLTAEDISAAEESPEETLRGSRRILQRRQARVARALSGSEPVLFKEGAGADQEFMRDLRRQAQELGAVLSILWAHPFTEERQLIGHRVPSPQDPETLVYGLGELTRVLRKAAAEAQAARREGRTPRKFILLIKNVEALEPGVRTQLQEVLRIRELTHPELGRVELPENLQLILTQRDVDNVEDDSFYDRTVVKVLPASSHYEGPRQALAQTPKFGEHDYRGFVRIEERGGRPVLLLPAAEIQLSAEFAGINDENMEDMIYSKTGLVLDYQTVLMLAAMARTKQDGGVMVRIQGPTGVGKTFTAQAFARLRGKTFHSNPVNGGTEFSEVVGGFEQDEKGLFRFNGETPVKRRLEEGGVVAASELNTLLDSNEKASLGWWLTQLAEAEPDKGGHRVIRLTEVPAAEGQEVPVIRVHPQALIVIDTNPEGEYGARGKLPETLKEATPFLELAPLVTGQEDQEKREVARLALYARMFLKHGFTARDGVGAPGLAGDLLEESAGKLAEAYWYWVKTHGQGRNGRVVSVREFKRMAQDFLAARAAEGNGFSLSAAITRAVSAHLDGDIAAASPWAQEPSGADFAGTVAEQLLARGRPVHLRVEADTDLRAELQAWQEEDPSLDLSLVNVTEEADRYVLEGGLVPDEKGEGLVYGAGIFARLIARAKANPEKKVVYVFDNAHNLRPEQIVASNEFLQEGKLFPKGAGGEALELPPNAHILFVSRSDSPLEWSAAERSRFVELEYSQGEAWRKAQAEKVLGPVLAALSPDIGQLMTRWLLRVYFSWRQAMLQSPSRAGLVSNAKFLRLSAAMAEALKAMAQDGPGPKAALAALRRAADDILLSALPPEERRAMGESLLASLATYGRIIARFLARLGTSLDKAKAAYASAGSEAEKAAALAGVQAALEAEPGQAWAPKKKGDAAPLDIIRTSQPKLVPGVVGTVLAATEDGRFVLARLAMSIVLYERKAKGFKEVWESRLESEIARAAITPDGNSIVVLHVVLHRAGPPWNALQRWELSPGKTGADGLRHYEALEAAVQERSTAIMSALAVSHDAKTVFVVDAAGLLHAYAVTAGKGRPGLEEVWSHSLGFIPLALACSPNGAFIVAAGPDGAARIYEAQGPSPEAGYARKPAEPIKGVVSASVSDEGRVALGTGKALSVLERSGLSLRGLFTVTASHPLAQASYVAQDPATGDILASDREAGMAFSLQGGTLVRRWRHPALARAWRISQEGDKPGFAMIANHGLAMAPATLIVRDEAAAQDLATGALAGLKELPEEVEALDEPPADWEQALDQGRRALAEAKPGEDTSKARALIQKALAATGPKARWSSKAADKLRELDVARVQALESVTRGLGPIHLLSATPDGRLVALAGEERELEIGIWDGRGYQPLWRGALDEPAQDIAFSADGKSFLVAEASARLGSHHPWGLAVLFAWEGSGEPAPGAGDFKPAWVDDGAAWAGGGYLVSAKLSADGRVILLGGSAGSVVARRWDGQTVDGHGRRAYRRREEIPFMSGALDMGLALSADGRRLAVHGKLWEWDGEAYQPLAGVGPGMASLDASGNIVAKVQDGVLKVLRWDPGQGRLIEQWFALMPALVDSLSLSPDGDAVLVVARGGKVGEYKRGPGEEGFALAHTLVVAHPSPIPAALIPGQGGKLVVDNRDGSLHRYAVREFAMAEQGLATFLDNGQTIPLADLEEKKVEALETGSSAEEAADALAKARVDYEAAETPEAKKKAGEEIALALEQGQPPWEEVPASELKPQNLIKAMALVSSQRAKAAASLLASTPDQRYVVAIENWVHLLGEVPTLVLYERHGSDYRMAWSKPLDAGVQATGISVSDDGRRILLATLVPSLNLAAPGFSAKVQLLEWNGSEPVPGIRRYHETWSVYIPNQDQVLADMSGDGKRIVYAMGGKIALVEWDGQELNPAGQSNYALLKLETHAAPLTHLRLARGGRAYAAALPGRIRVVSEDGDGKFSYWEEGLKEETVVHLELDASGEAFAVATAPAEKKKARSWWRWWRRGQGDEFDADLVMPVEPRTRWQRVKAWWAAYRARRKLAKLAKELKLSGKAPPSPDAPLPPSKPDWAKYLKEQPASSPKSHIEVFPASGTLPLSSFNFSSIYQSFLHGFRVPPHKVRVLRRHGKGFKTAWGTEVQGLSGLSLSADGRTVAALAGNSATTYSAQDPAGEDFAQSWRREFHGVPMAGAVSRNGKGLLVSRSIFGTGRLNDALDLFEEQALIVKDSKSAAVLATGEEAALAALPARVQRLAETEPPEEESPRFTPRYGDKPFYFAADARGKVYLNYKGTWIATRHKLAQGVAETPGLGPEEASIGGKTTALKAVALSDLLDPYAEDGSALSKSDFLMETPVLEEVEESCLWALRDGWAVNLIGRPGGGKTSIARELGLLLGLPRFVFQMHGERELSDVLGSYREDKDGRIHLTARSYTDEKGRRRFRQPLLDFLVNGGVFDLDEGAVGDRAREFMSWFAAVAAGDREIILHEFPGHEERLPLHPDFHLVVTNNLIEETAGRQAVKSEIGSRVHTIYVDEDESPKTLERLFLRFLGLVSVSPEESRAWARAAALLHHALKPMIGKKLGRDNKDRFYLSKREIRRLARQVKLALAQDPEMDPGYALYRGMRVVYEAMFPHPEERGRALGEIEKVLEQLDLLKDPDYRPPPYPDGWRIPLLDETAAARRGFFSWLGFIPRWAARVWQGVKELLSLVRTGPKLMEGLGNINQWERRFAEEAALGAPLAATESEALVGWLTQALLSQGEPVLYLTETGARSEDSLLAAARRLPTPGVSGVGVPPPLTTGSGLGARLQVVDAAPEHGELELLGGLLPVYGPRPPGTPRARDARGALSRHLVSREELDRLESSGEAREPVVLWIRNVDQWKEELRTAINGLLEDGYIDLEVDGRVQRFYRPPHLAFIAEMPADSTSEFSSAFFNRWVKVGVSADSTEPGPGGQAPEMTRVLRSAYGLEPQAAAAVTLLAKTLFAWDREGGWAERRDQEIGPSLIYALAEAMRRARRESPALGWAEALAQEAWRLIGSRLSAEKAGTDIPDSERFAKLLAIVLGRAAAPKPSSELATVDGSLDSAVASVGGIPARRRPGALTLRQALRKNGIRLTRAMKEALALLARADSLGRAAALVGETGAGKTTVGALWAGLTGRRYYKYQAHAGSELADLTIDIEQAETGEFKKRVKEFYRLLREGRVVIDFDEANVAPWVLWAVEPLLRGERWVQPIFPEEPPFEVGDGVQVLLTYNPERYSGRGRVDRRLLERMAVGWMGLPEPEEAARIIETFYGVWEEPPSFVSKERRPREKPLGKPRKKAAVKGSAPKAREKGDRLMREGLETFDPSKEPAASAGRGQTLGQEPQGIFTPELYPYNRLGAFDAFDENAQEWARDPSAMERVEAFELSAPGLEAREKAVEKSHDLFWGQVSMDLGPEWQLLPSAGAAAAVLGIEATGEGGAKLGAGLELARDSADNLYARAAKPGLYELRFRLAVPASYFGRAVPKGIAFPYPDDIPDEVRKAMALIGLTGKESDFREILYKLIAYFRDFSLEKNGIKHSLGASLYLDLIRSQCGVCRHRAFAFGRTLLGLGIPARYVVSENHAWAEVEVPGTGWLRVDLGGGGDPANMDLSNVSGQRHQARGLDDFPEPEAYRKNQADFAERMDQAARDQGLADQGGGGASGGGGGGGSASGNGGGAGQAELDEARIAKELAAFSAKVKEDVKLHDELSELFAAGQGDTQFIFSRMLKAMQDRLRIIKRLVKKGLEIDPVAFMLRKPRQFVARERLEKMQSTAVSFFFDLSGSQQNIKAALAFAIAATGVHGHALKETAPQHFRFDLSWMADAPVTVVGLRERITPEELGKRLVAMSNRIGQGGTEILPALQKKREEFMEVREARAAKNKYMVFFTDGDDGAVVKAAPGGGWELTPAAREELERYRQAGIELFLVGYGPHAKKVSAFSVTGTHYVRIADERPFDIAEAIAKIAELKSRGAGLIPPGDIGPLLQLGP